ncbi:MAG: phytanoyl-CoA dioxygenase family protein [Pyrinomonadaceae bacterium]|nr:phytanoyl-CoA dioxygenase family protein [Pyrinomonadaceae bacterium]
MVKGDGPILTKQQFAEYEELGFLHSIPILSQDEISYYRAQVEKTCQAIGGRVTRLNALHLFFPWAWELSTHPRLLDCLEQLLGPNIVLKSTRVIYKYGKSASYVGWHQDGITERLEDGRAPAVWLGLTAATLENGCLRVVPRSHRLGLMPHDSSPDLEPLPGSTSAPVESWFQAHGDELSERITSVPTDSASGFDIVMPPGQMSIHHPVILHGSNPNLSNECRIGLSASFSAPELYHGRRAVAWVRGDGRRDYHRFEVIDKPPMATFEEAVDAYCASDRPILFAAV